MKAKKKGLLTPQPRQVSHYVVYSQPAILHAFVLQIIWTKPLLASYSAFT